MADRILYCANDLPVLQNRMFATQCEALASLRGDIVLAVDEGTGLVRNVAFDETKLVYDKTYQNEQALSQSFRAHLDEVTGVIDRWCSGLSLVEIGCGKAHYLDHLRSRGYDAVGVDPSYEGTSSNITMALYTPELGITGGAFILRHVLEHIKDPMNFLFEIHRANHGSGLIYIEVPCFDWICAQRAWFDVFYEHVNYFRLSDFRRMFGRVLEAGCMFGGQYIYALADLATLRRPTRDGAGELDFPSDFAGTQDTYRKLPQRPRAIWGAASKGVIFSMHLRSAGVNVDMAIDINPAKQGRYLPCTGLRVVSPQEAIAHLPQGSEVFVMNSNYLDEIRTLGGGGFAYRTIDAGTSFRP